MEGRGARAGEDRDLKLPSPIADKRGTMPDTEEDAQPRGRRAATGSCMHSGPGRSGKGLLLEKELPIHLSNSLPKPADSLNQELGGLTKIWN